MFNHKSWHEIKSRFWTSIKVLNILEHSAGSHWVALSHAELHWVMLRYAKLSLVELSYTKSSWVELSQAESSWVKLSQAESSWVKLSQAESSWDKLSWKTIDISILVLFNSILLFNSLKGVLVFFFSHLQHAWTASNRTNKPILSTSRKSA